MLRIERIRASQSVLLKALRCRALAEAPYAFSGTLEQALKRSDESWAAWAENCASNPKASTFIAYYNEEPCGMMACDIYGEENEIAELLAVWVAPEYRRLSVGQALLEVVKQWAKEGNAQILNAWVAEKNGAAIGFYKSVGFQATGERGPLNSETSEERILLMLPFL